MQQQTNENETATPQLIEVTIDSIPAVVSNRHQYYVLVLKEQGKDRYLHIWTGPCEGTEIDSHRKGIQHSRPLTFDLMKTLIDLSNLQVDHITINKVQGRLYFGTIALSRGDRKSKFAEIDCRPSDAINLAIRMDVPIFVSADVMDKAGKTSREVARGILPGRLKQQGFMINVLIWTLLGISLSWEPGGPNDLSRLFLFAPVGALLGALQGLVDSVVVRAISAATLLSVVLGAEWGWIGAIVGAVLGGLVVGAFWMLGKAIAWAKRRESNASSSKPS